MLTTIILVGLFLYRTHRFRLVPLRLRQATVKHTSFEANGLLKKDYRFNPSSRYVDFVNLSSIINNEGYTDGERNLTVAAGGLKHSDCIPRYPKGSSCIKLTCLVYHNQSNEPIRVEIMPSYFFQCITFCGVLFLHDKLKGLHSLFVSRFCNPLQLTSYDDTPQNPILNK